MLASTHSSKNIIVTINIESDDSGPDGAKYFVNPLSTGDTNTTIGWEINGIGVDGTKEVAIAFLVDNKIIKIYLESSNTNANSSITFW